MWAGQCISWILDGIYPRRCPFCDGILPAYDWKNRGKPRACATCERELIYAQEPLCKKCGKPLYSERTEYCEDCKRKKHVFVQGRSFLSYQGKTRQSIYRLKYSNKREYADYFADEMWERQGAWVRRMQPDLIVPVPLYYKKERRRGYNQAWILAQKLAQKSHIPAKKNCILRVRDTAPQKNLSDVQRRQNLKGAFVADRKAVAGKKILLVDDIYTTGITADEVSAALLQAGCAGVYIFTVAIGG